MSTFMNNWLLRRAMSAPRGGGGISYQRIEYLESTGTQYIDTYIRPLYGDVMSIDMTIQFTNQRVDSWTTGWRVGSGNSYLIAGLYNSGIYFTFRDDSNNVTYTSDVYGKHRVRFNMDGGVLIDDTLLSDTIANNSPLLNDAPNNLSIFTSNSSNSGKFIREKLFSYKLFINNVLVRDFVPVRDGQTGYLYDIVTEQLFENSGTGDFVLGPDVN